MNYIVVKNATKYDIDYMEYDNDGLVIHPKLKGNAYVHVSTAKFYNEDLINKIIVTKFRRQFNNLAKVIFNYLNADEDSADSGDYIILLDEVAHMQATMEIRYKRYMENEQYREYMDKLYFLNINLKNKLARVNYVSQMNNQFSSGIRR